MSALDAQPGSRVGSGNLNITVLGAGARLQYRWRGTVGQFDHSSEIAYGSRIHVSMGRLNKQVLKACYIPSSGLNSWKLQLSHSTSTKIKSDTRYISRPFIIIHCLDYHGKLVHTMLIKFLGFLALLVPELSRASPVTKPEDLLALEKRTNIGSYVNYFPDCSQDPSNAEGPSAYKDGDGVPVTSSCDNKLSTPAVNRYHCW